LGFYSGKNVSFFFFASIVHHRILHNVELTRLGELRVCFPGFYSCNKNEQKNVKTSLRRGRFFTSKKWRFWTSSCWCGWGSPCTIISLYYCFIDSLSFFFSFLFSGFVAFFFLIHQKNNMSRRWCFLLHTGKMSLLNLWTQFWIENILSEWAFVKEITS